MAVKSNNQRAAIRAGWSVSFSRLLGHARGSFSNCPAETPDDVGSAPARTSACSDGNTAFLA